MIAFTLILLALFILNFYVLLRIKKRKGVKISLDEIKVNLVQENNGIRVLSNGINVILAYQDHETVSSIIIKNFPIVNKYYKAIVGNNLNKNVEIRDINLISLDIVLYYYFIENMHRRNLNKLNAYDFNFDTNELNSVGTYDLIIGYFKKNYPDEWREKCSIVMGITLEGFNILYSERELFYNR